MKTTVKTSKSDRNDNITLTMTGMTLGKCAALLAALEGYSKKSAVAFDVFCSVRNALSSYEKDEDTIVLDSDDSMLSLN